MTTTISNTRGPVQQHPAKTLTGDPRRALAWLQSGKPLRIEALNLRDHQRHIRALMTQAAMQAEGGAA